MSKMQQMLLALGIFFFSLTSFAQTSVNIEISGVEKYLEDNVRLFLSIAQQKDNPLMSEGRMRRLHKKAPLEIVNALRPFGYYRPEVKTAIKQLAHDQWQLSYDIVPGPPLLVSQFSFTISEEMGNDPEFKLLIKSFALHKGDVFSHIEYESIKANLAKLASERGYFNARFIEHHVEIDLDAYEVRIQLNYEGGPRYLFGEVILKQNVINEELLRRYIPFETGSPYTINELIDFQQALNDSDYFQVVEVSAAKPRTDSLEIPVNVSLTPRKNHRYSFGVGYGTDTGARTKFGWDMPRLNPEGHRISTEVRISEIGYRLSANYRVPVLNPRTDQMVYSAGVENETTDSSESTIRTIGASLNRSHGKWRESIFLNYQQEDFVIADVEGDSVLLIPGVSWSRTWGDDFINTFDGLRFDISLRGASNKLVSDTDFSQAQGGIKAITPLNPRNRIITRGRLGSTWTEEFNQLPSSVRFFAGGAQSVRGYSYESLGPVDENGRVVGGKHLMIGSIEYEHSFASKWGFALFIDGGNAIDNLSDDLERGAGFGFRWKSPVGPIRVDLASAVTREGKPWRLHINIGPDL